MRYPHVRLAFTNNLVTHGDCVKAFAETARECGLLCPDDLCDVERLVASGACGSLTMAGKVLHATIPDVSNELWQQLVVRVDEYKNKRRLAHCRGEDQSPTVIGCGGMAPVVLDLLLQIITPYLPD